MLVQVECRGIFAACRLYFLSVDFAWNRAYAEYARVQSVYGITELLLASFGSSWTAALLCVAGNKTQCTEIAVPCEQ